MTNEIKLPEPDAWQSIRVGYTADTVRQLITEAVAAERDKYANLQQLVRKLHSAKGRYHTQLAACDLYDSLGLPNERPKK